MCFRAVALSHSVCVFLHFFSFLSDVWSLCWDLLSAVQLCFSLSGYDSVVFDRLGLFARRLFVSWEVR